MKMARWHGGRVAEQRRRASNACHPATLPLCLLFIAACGGGKAGTASKPTMHDSAGVAIVENTAPVWQKGGGWTLTPKPTTSIGVLDGATEYQLFQVAGAVRLSNGTIVVANGGTDQIRFYDSTGHFLESAGRKGGGPGEFKQMGTVFRFPGDTVGVADWSLQRMSLFTPGGEFVRSFPIAAPGGRGFVQPIAVFSDGSLLAQIQSFGAGGPPKSGIHRDSATYVRLDETGAVRDTIGTFLGTEELVIAETNMIMMTYLPFGRGSFITAHDSSVVFGANDSYAFEWLDRAGHVRRIVRRAHTPTPLTDADVSKYKEERLADAPDDNQRKFEQRILDKTTFPKTIPAYKSIQTDAAGDVWVQAYTAPGDSSNDWSVFNTDGWLLGTVALPPNFRPNQFGADYVLGIWKDENDVEHVMEYGIRKPEAGGKEGA